MLYDNNDFISNVMGIECVCYTTAKWFVMMLPNISISLINIYAFCLTENVALGKPAWQQHPYYIYRWGAERAVDGKYSDMSHFDGK